MHACLTLCMHTLSLIHSSASTAVELKPGHDHGAGFIDSDEVCYQPQRVGAADRRCICSQLSASLQCWPNRHPWITGCLPPQFIVLRGGTPSVPALLQHMMAFEPIGALVMNW